jgi:hypothetical protein
MDNPFFFKLHFFLPNVQHSFWKLFYNPIEHIWLKNAFELKGYAFWKCGFKKSCSYLHDKGHECKIKII